MVWFDVFLAVLGLIGGLLLLATAVAMYRVLQTGTLSPEKIYAASAGSRQARSTGTPPQAQNDR